MADPPARLAGLPSRALDDGLVVFEAATHLARLKGLAGLRSLPADHGLLLPRTRSVHTVGMRFALDLLWLDRDGAVLRVDHAVGPWRQRAAWRARAVVEVGAGRAEAFLASWRP